MWLNEPRNQAMRGRPVLVVGAGVSGMTLAIGLAQRGIDVHVVEPEQAPFDLQRQCDSRWLDPVQYDWPMDHWKAEQFPWDGFINRVRRLVPFPCRAGRASTLVKDWDRELEAYLQEPFIDHVKFHWGRYLEDYPYKVVGEPWLTANLRDRQRDNLVYRGRFAAVILAIGFGAERSTIDVPSDFTGHRFWETDSLEDPTYGGRIKPGHDRVLISGTGDGGLQDFLRVMTRKPSARQVFGDLGLDSKGLRLDFLHSLENRMERAAAWANPRASAYPFSTEPYLVERFRLVSNEVDRLLDDAPCSEQVLGYLRSRPAMTYLISQTSYFGCFYGLNLFLAMLLVRSEAEPRPESARVAAGDRRPQDHRHRHREQTCHPDTSIRCRLCRARLVCAARRRQSHDQRECDRHPSWLGRKSATAGEARCLLPSKLSAAAAADSSAQGRLSRLTTG